MLQKILIASLALAVATFSAATPASAHHGRHMHNAFVNDSGLLVDNDDEQENDEDVVSVAEPVYFTRVQQTEVVYQPQVVPVSDTIVTPYGYVPQYANGYYQGYSYSPQYAYNPYYTAAAYSNQDPVAAAVVNTVVSAAANGGHISQQQLITSLVSGFLASQAQQQFQSQPVFVQQQVEEQPVFVPQQVMVRQFVQPVVAPGTVFVRTRGWHRGEGEHGEHHGDHGDHGGGDQGDGGDR